MSATRKIAVPVAFWSCLLGFAGCGRSSLDGISLGAGGYSGEGGGAAADSAIDSTSDSGSGGPSSGGGDSGIILTCTDSATCTSGKVCCAIVNLSAGLSASSACSAGPCPSGVGNYQLCSSATECLVGDGCQPNPLGMGPKICVSGVDGGIADAAAAAPPSCRVGGPGRTNCGAAIESCCTSLGVTGGTYFRAYTNSGSGPTGEANAATVSSFQLDKYAVTVGRFREFVAAWNHGSGYTPPVGSGRHGYLNGGQGLEDSAGSGTYEPGWLSSEDGSIAPTDANLACSGSIFGTAAGFSTWTSAAGSQENLPINCVTWQEAFAFCIWDGGFLPSEAEWEYAAAGGSQQREYPWGTAAPGTANQYAIYACHYPGGASCSGLANIAPVGTATLGAGFWGQLDLAGNLWQWNLDSYVGYVDPCTDCAFATAGSRRVFRGGMFNSLTTDLFPPSRSGGMPTARDYAVGLRCARTP